jgi:hypothetical protein
VSSGGRKTYRLSLRRNRRVGHAIHMAAITQIRNRHSDGRTYYDRKVRHEAPHDRAEVKDLRHRGRCPGRPG